MQSDISGATSRRKTRRQAPPAIALSSAFKCAAAGLAIAFMAGCGATHTEQGAVLERKQQSAQNLLGQVGRTLPPRTASPSASSNLPQGAEFATNRARLPERLREARAIRYASAGPVKITEALARLSDLSNVPHVLLAGPDGKPVRFGTAEDGTGLAPLGLEHPVHADFDGSLPEILDQIASQFGLAWRYDNGRVVLRQFLTGRYRLAALPAQSSFSSSVGKTSSTGSVNLPGEITDALTLIAGDGARLTFGEASGILTVIARPAAQRRVAEYVRELNEFLSRQVAFDVNVLSVTHRHADQFAFGFDLFAGSLKDDWVLLSASQPQAAGGIVNVGVVSGNVGLELLMAALDRHGDVSVETRTGATTSNNQIVPIQVVNQTAYAKSIKSVSGSGGETGTTIEPGTLTTGFEMQLLPRILQTGDILLRYSIKLSDLNELAEFTSDKQTIQLPRLSTTSFEQQAILGNDETLVLMGFERDRKSIDRPGNGILAGLSGIRSGTETERISTVLTIRPRIARTDRRAGQN